MWLGLFASNMSSLLAPPYLYAKYTNGHKNLGCQEGKVMGSYPHISMQWKEGGARGRLVMA